MKRRRTLDYDTTDHGRASWRSPLAIAVGAFSVFPLVVGIAWIIRSMGRRRDFEAELLMFGVGALAIASAMVGWSVTLWFTDRE